MPSLTILAKALLATLGFICWYQVRFFEFWWWFPVWVKIAGVLSPVINLVFSFVQKSIIWVYGESLFLITYVLCTDFDRFLLLDVLHWPFIVLCWLLFVPYLLLIMLLWLLVTLKSSWTKFYKSNIFSYYRTGHPVLIFLYRSRAYSPLIFMALSSDII